MSLLLVVLVEDGLSLRSVREYELFLNARLLVHHVAHRFFHEVALDLASLHFDTLSLVLFLHLLDETFELRLAIVPALRSQHEAEAAHLFVVSFGLHEHGFQLLSETCRALTLQEQFVELFNRLFLENELDTAFGYFADSHSASALDLELLEEISLSTNNGLDKKALLMEPILHSVLSCRIDHGIEHFRRFPRNLIQDVLRVVYMLSLDSSCHGSKLVNTVPNVEVVRFASLTFDNYLLILWVVALRHGYLFNEIEVALLLINLQWNSLNGR